MKLDEITFRTGQSLGGRIKQQLDLDRNKKAKQQERQQQVGNIVKKLQTVDLPTVETK